MSEHLVPPNVESSVRLLVRKFKSPLLMKYFMSIKHELTPERIKRIMRVNSFVPRIKK